MRAVALCILGLLDKLDRLIKVLCIAIIGAMTCVVVAQVVFRYFFADPLTWSEELSRYLLVWGAFLAGSSLIRRQENMYVDFFINKLSPGKLKIVKLFTHAVTFCFLIFLFYYANKVIPRIAMRQLTPALGISMFYVQLSIIVGLGLMILQTIRVFLADLLDRGD